MSLANADIDDVNSTEEEIESIDVENENINAETRNFLEEMLDKGEDFGNIGGSGRLNVRTGQVQSFHARRGWGVIRDIDSNETYFVHHSGIQPQLPPIVEGWRPCLYSGEYVEFVVCANPTRPDSLCAQCVTGIRGGKLMCDLAAWKVLFYRRNSQESQSPQSPIQKRRRTR